MAQDYTPLWKELGLDLSNHCRLLDGLMTAYPDLYLSQKDRPAGMGYFDFVVSEAHGLRIKELADHKARGGKVVGTFCLYAPEEIILAAGAIDVGLCAGTEFSIPAAESVLPAALCPLIKSAFGFKVGKVCPYFESADLLVGETTCDGKKKVWELLGQHQPMHVMETPHCRGDDDRELWRKEVHRLAERLERLAGRPIGAADLERAIARVDAKRIALARLGEARRADPAPISGKDSLLIEQIAFYDDVERFTGKVNELCDELARRISTGTGVAPKGAPRLVVAGSPLALPNWKLHHLIETSGGVVVAEEGCVGTRYYTSRVQPSGGGRPGLLSAIADRYLTINCACFTPNQGRVDDIVRIVRETGAHGVIHNSLVFCQPYIVEAVSVRQALQKEGIPVLVLETDYGDSDAGRLTTRIQGFLETLRAR